MITVKDESKWERKVRAETKRTMRLLLIIRRVFILKIARKTQGVIFELKTIVNGSHAAHACTGRVALMQQLHLLESEKSFALTLNI